MLKWLVKNESRNEVNVVLSSPATSNAAVSRESSDVPSSQNHATNPCVNEVSVATSQQSKSLFSQHDDWIAGDNIYLGIYRYGDSPARSVVEKSLYMRVDQCTRKFVLLGTKANGTSALAQVDELPFDYVSNIACGPVEPYSNQCFIAFDIRHWRCRLSLNSVDVGKKCMLCPSLTESTIDSAKYVLVLLDQKALEAFRGRVESLTGIMHTIMTGRLYYKSEWPSHYVKSYLFAHEHRSAHTAKELRIRAARELKNKKRREAYSARVKATKRKREESESAQANLEGDLEEDAESVLSELTDQTPDIASVMRKHTQCLQIMKEMRERIEYGFEFSETYIDMFFEAERELEDLLKLLKKKM